MRVVLYLLITLFWGGSYLAIRFVVAEYPPIFAAGMRVAVACCAFAGLAWRAGTVGTWAQRAPIAWCALSGAISMGIGWATLFWGVRPKYNVPPAVAAVIAAAGPIFSTLTTPWIMRYARVSRRQWIGIVLGFAGICLVFAPQLFDHAATKISALLAVTVTAAAYGVSIAMNQRFADAIAPQTAAFWHSLPAAVILLGVSALTEERLPWSRLMASPRALGAFAYLTLCSSILAQLFWFALVRRIGHVTTSTILYCVPVVALLLDGLVLRHVPHVLVWLGVAVILLGVRLTHVEK